MTLEKGAEISAVEGEIKGMKSSEPKLMTLKFPGRKIKTMQMPFGSKSVLWMIHNPEEMEMIND